MNHYDYRTAGTCSVQVSFDIENGKVYNVAFLGGCNGNLKAIGKLCEGMDGHKLVETLKGNTCGHKPTSCADQLARAVEKALAEEGR